MALLLVVSSARRYHVAVELGTMGNRILGIGYRDSCCYGGSLPPFPTDRQISVRTLKRHLRSLHGLPLCLQRLVHGSSLLNDADKLELPMEIQLLLMPSSAQTDQAEEELGEAVCDDVYVEAVRFLLAAGVNKDAWTGGNYYDCSRTPLMRAIQFGRIETVQLLLQANADMDLTDAHGNTALFLACDHRCHTRAHAVAARLLVEAGADKDRRNRHGMTALICAAGGGLSEIVSMLLEAGVNKNVADRQGNTALLHAAHLEHCDVTRLLLEAGAETDLRNNVGETGTLLRNLDQVAIIWT